MNNQNATYHHSADPNDLANTEPFKNLEPTVTSLAQLASDIRAALVADQLNTSSTPANTILPFL